jgi:hypothetical protein
VADDKRIREWIRLTHEVADSGDRNRFELLYRVVLADRGEARSSDARHIAEELLMTWGRIEQRPLDRGVKR